MKITIDCDIAEPYMVRRYLALAMERFLENLSEDDLEELGLAEIDRYEHDVHDEPEIDAVLEHRLHVVRLDCERLLKRLEEDE